jgi:chemotaxis protein CheD
VIEREAAATPSIRMGEMAVAVNDGVLRTLLGSCVGLALYDRRRKVGGLAHIVLPNSQGRTGLSGKFVDTAIPALIDQVERLAGPRLTLTATIAGGASMFPTAAASNIGAQNVEASEALLAELRIPVVARHCGGEQGRRMSLDTSTGVVTIEIVGSDPIRL